MQSAPVLEWPRSTIVPVCLATAYRQSTASSLMKKPETLKTSKASWVSFSRSALAVKRGSASSRLPSSPLTQPSCSQQSCPAQNKGAHRWRQGPCQ